MNYRKAPMCPVCRKAIFTSKQMAREHLAHLLRFKSEDYRKPGLYAVSPYQCPEGYGWHVGRDHRTIMINFKKGRIKNVEQLNHTVPDTKRVSVRVRQQKLGLGKTRNN